MKTAVALCCLLAVAMAAINPEWEDFKIKFGRKYSNPTEEFFRKKIFLNNKMLIDQNNQRYAEGKSTFTMGINHFSDLTTQEFSSMMNGYKQSKDIPNTNHTRPFNPPSGPLLGAVDWRTKNCITPVKDQGICGSCWAFSATGAMEFSYCNIDFGLFRLSEQNLIDCTYNYGNQGCTGGRMDWAFQYVIDNYGVDTEASYPYRMSDTARNCRYNYYTIGATIYTYVKVKSGDENSLAQAVGVSVVSVAIDGSQNSFQHYAGGYYYEPACSSTNLNHAVLVVGYGTDTNGDYWIAKNSYSKNWGKDGYINMARNNGNNCGIATDAYYPLS